MRDGRASYCAIDQEIAPRDMWPSVVNVNKVYGRATGVGRARPARASALAASWRQPAARPGFTARPLVPIVCTEKRSSSGPIIHFQSTSRPANHLWAARSGSARRASCRSCDRFEIVSRAEPDAPKGAIVGQLGEQQVAARAPDGAVRRAAKCLLANLLTARRNRVEFKLIAEIG